MLTDKQIIALSLLKNSDVISTAGNIVWAKTLINDALAVADMFLEASTPKQMPDDLIKQFQLNNQRLQQINDGLLDSQYLESTLGD
jgi:hypothetical protein